MEGYEEEDNTCSSFRTQLTLRLARTGEGEGD